LNKIFVIKISATKCATNLIINMDVTL